MAKGISSRVSSCFTNPTSLACSYFYPSVNACSYIFLDFFIKETTVSGGFLQILKTLSLTLMQPLLKEASSITELELITIEFYAICNFLLCKVNITELELITIEFYAICNFLLCKVNGLTSLNLLPTDPCNPGIFSIANQSPIMHLLAMGSLLYT